MLKNRRLSFRGCTCCIAVPPLSSPAPARRRLNPRRVYAGSDAPRGGLVAAAAGPTGPSTSAQGGPGTSSAQKPHRIDTHHHIAPPKFIDEMRSLLQPPTLAWSIEKSIEDMDKAGVATSITSITTPGV